LGIATLELGATGFIREGDQLAWELPEPVALRDAASGREIGRLESAAVRIVGDPVIVLIFNVTSAGAPTQFTITSAAVGFPAIADALGRASVAMTVTDLDGGGAGVTGVNPDNQVYEAFYASSSVPPGTGSTFATLIDGSAAATPYTSNQTTSEFPAGPGLSATAESGALLGSVASMSVRADFTLQAGDSASATSVYEIQPPFKANRLRVSANGEAGAAEVDLALEPVAGSEGRWATSAPRTLVDRATGAPIARVESVSVASAADHAIELAFGVVTGQFTTNFQIVSASLSFPVMANALARATVAVTATDFSGGGTTLTGLNADGTLYQAFYNDVGGVAASGATFATLQGGLVAVPFSSSSAQEEFAAAGAFSATDESGAVLAAVSSLSVRFNFSLGPMAAASATSVFALAGGGTVRARVFEDADGNGVQDAGEPGFPGIDVWITDSLSATQTVTTDANGDAIAAVPVGSTTVDVDDATLPANLELTAGTDPVVVDVVAAQETAVAFGYRRLPIQAIPTLGRFGLLALGAVLVLGALLALRRRRVA